MPVVRTGRGFSVSNRLTLSTSATAAVVWYQSLLGGDRRVNYNAALINGWWWWWLAPLVIILVVFLGLFFLTVGLDEIANPRLRRAG